MTTVEKHRLLVERLYKKTIERLLTWTFDGAVDEVDLSISGKLLSIGHQMNDDGIPVIYVRIRSEGTLVEQFDDESISGVIPDLPEFETYYQLLGELYKVAKRQADGSDNILDDLLDELDEVPF